MRLLQAGRGAFVEQLSGPANGLSFYSLWLINIFFCPAKLWTTCWNVGSKLSLHSPSLHGLLRNLNKMKFWEWDTITILHRIGCVYSLFYFISAKKVLPSRKQLEVHKIGQIHELYNATEANPMNYPSVRSRGRFQRANNTQFKVGELKFTCTSGGTGTGGNGTLKNAASFSIILAYKSIAEPDTDPNRYW